MSQLGKAKTSDKVTKIRTIFMSKLLGPIATLALLITLGMLGAYWFDLLTGWEVVALLATLVVPMVVGLAILYRHNIRLRGS